jgi:hypothetical protein
LRWVDARSEAVRPKGSCCARETRRPGGVFIGTADAAVRAHRPVTAQLRVRTSGAWFDLFVRLCDVDERGVSMNVCDGIQRSSADMTPDAEGLRTVDVRLSPTG